MVRLLPVVSVIALAAAIGGAPSRASDTPAQAVAGPAAAVRGDEPSEDPFPIQRVRATEAQLADLVKQLDAGPLVRLPRSEFERRVRAAGRAAAEAKLLPRITAARFRASLVGGDLVGTGEIDIVNLAATPRYLPLDPLRLALGSATWADGREAVLGVPPGGRGAAVWIERPGRQTLKFSWSLAGIAELGERRFEMRVPMATTAELVLELPDKQIPTASAVDVLLTGPFPAAGNPPREEWRFRFGGRPRLDFALRPAGNAGAVAAAALVASYDIVPGQVTCGFEYDLRPAKGTVAEWGFTVDPELHITDVVVNNRAGWTIDPPAALGQPRTLRIALHQPGAGGKVLVSAVAPFPNKASRTDGQLPIVRPIGASLAVELLTIRLAPGLKPENWHAGDYRLTDFQVRADQSRSYTLTGTLLPPGADRVFRRMPALGIALVEAEFSTAEQIGWRFDADRASVDLRAAVRVRRGALFQLVLTVPPDYHVKRVDSVPDDLVGHQATVDGALTVEFARPLQAGQSAELRVTFDGPALPAPRTLPFPAFVPLGAAERSGVLAILRGPHWMVDPAPGVGAQPAAWFDFAEPRVPQDAVFAFRFRAASADGAVSLIPRSATFSAQIATAAVAHASEFASTTFALSVRSGGLTSLIILERAASASPRTWHVVGGGNAVVSAIALPMDALMNPIRLLAANSGHGMARERIWLIRFARPVMGALALKTTVPRVSSPESGGGAPSDHDDPSGGWSIPGATTARNSAPGPSSREPSASPPRRWAFAGMYLVTAVQSPSDVLVVFGGTINSSAGTSLPLRLPPRAMARAAIVGGHWLEPAACRLSGDGVLRLPVSESGPVRFEVRYTLPAETHGPLGRVQSPEPGLPDDGTAIRRLWAFAPAVLPGWPMRAWDRGDASDLPGFLGDPPATGSSGLLVSRTAVEDVRIGTARLANGLGIAIAAGLFALIWAGGRRAHPFCAIMAVAVLLALGGARMVGPPWWQHAAAVPLLVGLSAAAGMVVVRGWRVAGPVAAAVGLAAFVHMETGAQITTPAVVIILPLDAQGRESVLAPKSVLDRLAVARPSPGVVISASSYSIRVNDGGARIVATYIAHALGDGEAVATLPLADARLEKVTVDKAEAFPAEARLGIYAVPLPGKGRHEIEVSFAVPIGGTGTERELRFGVPECPATRLAADLPGAAQQAQVVGRVGRRSSVDGERVTLASELGSVKTIHLRWREGTGGTATVKVREGCVWDVAETGAELTACYLVSIEQGTVGVLQFLIPDELEPLAITTRALDPNGVVAIRDWSLGKKAGSFRPLRIDFQAPISGRLLVVMTCAPRKAITRQPLLRFPKPVLPGGPVEPDAAFALRTKGVVVDERGQSGVIDFAPDALTLDFGRVEELWRNPSASMRVFRPTPNGVPELRPTIRVDVEPPGATLETIWRLGPRLALATGVLHWAGTTAPELLEFDLPSAKLLELHGAEIASWDQVGARVHVWMRRPAKEGEIEWLATAPASAAPFDAVAPRPLGMKLLGDTVRLRAVEGYRIHVERDRGWTGLNSADEAVTFSTTNPAAPPVRMRLVPAPRPDRVQYPTRMQPARLPQSTAEARGPGPAPAAANPPDRAPAGASPDAPRWVWPVSTAIGWTLAGMVLMVLLARFPRTAWPEEFALIVGWLGAVINGYWWLGIAAWALARLVWVARQPDRLSRRAGRGPSVAS